MLSSKASWVWYMNIARSCFYFHISLLYTYFTLRLTIYRSRTQISLPIYLHRTLGPKYNTLVFSYPSFYIWTLQFDFKWCCKRFISIVILGECIGFFFMNTNEFTIDCILRGLAWKFENQIESFRFFCFCYYFWKKKIWYLWFKKSKRWNWFTSYLVELAQVLNLGVRCTKYRLLLRQSHNYM